jgi:hypothetical protein
MADHFQHSPEMYFDEGNDFSYAFGSIDGVLSSVDDLWDDAGYDRKFCS